MKLINFVEKKYFLLKINNNYLFLKQSKDTT